MSFYKDQIKATEEFRRIKALPRRVWAAEDAEQLAVRLTEKLRKPGGTMQLRPIQAVA